MYQYHCLNAISNAGLENFNENYVKVENINDAFNIFLQPLITDIHIILGYQV